MAFEDFFRDKFIDAFHAELRVLHCTLVLPCEFSQSNPVSPADHLHDFLLYSCIWEL